MNVPFVLLILLGGRRFRTRNPQNVIQEIKYLVENFGVKEIHFCDDNITLNKRYIADICTLLIQEGINISWQCPNGVRIDTLDRDLLQKMKKAGCYSIGLGIESGNQIVLDRIKKKLNLDKVRKIIKDVQDVGIRLYGFFIIGLPGETEKTIWDTIRFAVENPFDRVWFCVLAPYPGSEIFSQLLREQDISLEVFPWDKLDTNTALIESNGLSCKTIERFQKIAVRKFYLRPKKMIDIGATLGLKEIITLLKSSFLKKIVGNK